MRFLRWLPGYLLRFLRHPITTIRDLGGPDQITTFEPYDQI